MAESGRIEELRRRLDREPGSRLFGQLAEELRKAGESGEAAKVARRGLVQHPGYTSARLTLARALLELGELPPARVELETVLRAAPDNILASRLLGDCLVAMEDLGSALLQFRATLRLSGSDRAVEAQIAGLEERLHGKAAASTEVSEPWPESATELPPTTSSESAASRTENEAVADSQGGPGVGTVTAKPETASSAPQSQVSRGDAPPEDSVLSSDPGVVSDDKPGEGAWDERGRSPGVASWVSMGPAEGAVLGGWPPGSEGGATGESPTADPGTGTVQGSEERLPEEVPSVSSATLAELYFQQGSPERAREVYRELLLREPGNERARARVEEIDALIGGRGRDTVSGGDRRERVRQTIALLEEWLDALQNAGAREAR